MSTTIDVATLDELILCRDRSVFYPVIGTRIRDTLILMLLTVLFTYMLYYSVYRILSLFSVLIKIPGTHD